ncbi:MAG: bifunctional phosphoribosylaminoimidazolecarboxamide formyltransferase/IMP cyclohydrolase [Nitrospirae bacterium]|nr:bifunctional phosphoribosylaminoimidazolecarboxamide formyltransferase/IMP cyclohydrolase [Nitrospirota bacterium]
MGSSSRRALVSVSDKTGLASLGKRLASLGFEILSTGGTARFLRDNGVMVTDVSTVTGFPEIMDGRVKTLHPKIHGALLGRRENPDHRRAMETHGIQPIDFVFVNLYPFSETVQKPGVKVEEAIEQIDIGGPSMIRSAAKNHESVTIVTDPADYDRVLSLLETGSEIPLSLRRELAVKAFRSTSTYDRLIVSYFEGLSDSSKDEVQPFPDRLGVSLERQQSLRYGENPHQKAALYRYAGRPEEGVAGARKIWGKEMSYNNYLDTDAAWKLVHEFSEPAVVIVKHNNPCGAALGASVLEAYQKARDTDPVSSFGGVVAVNRAVDPDCAREMARIFLEVVVAPGFTAEAKEILTRKKDIRLLEIPENQGGEERFEIRTISGGVLVQSPDTTVAPDLSLLKIAGEIQPTPAQIRDALFAFAVGKHVKSNAIILARDGLTVGIGAGQMSRVDSVRLSGMKATRPTAGSVLASDAFFPFRDGIDEAAKLGVSGIIQPGGSIRDEEVLAAVREHKMFMILTGVRHFRH